MLFQPHTDVEKAAAAAGRKPGDGTGYWHWLDEDFGMQERFGGATFEAALCVARTLAPIDEFRTAVIEERVWIGPKHDGRWFVVRSWKHTEGEPDPVESKPDFVREPEEA